jgi:hypothetical protein
MKDDDTESRKDRPREVKPAAKDTRWKPGQSGNPKGRPRKDSRPITKRQVRADVLRAIERPVTVRIDGQPKTVPIFHAILDQLLLRAAQGQLTAARPAIQLRRDLVSEHETAQSDLAETLLAFDRGMKEKPEEISPEDEAMTSEIRRRVYDPYTFD